MIDFTFKMRGQQKKQQCLAQTQLRIRTIGDHWAHCPLIERGRSVVARHVLH